MSNYYSTQKIDKKNATYNVIFGERSNGKTYALLLKSIKINYNIFTRRIYGSTNIFITTNFYSIY